MAIVEKINIKDDIKNESFVPDNTSKIIENNKSKNFVGSVFAELKKVEWPNLKYVLKWCVLIVIFTGSFALVMGTIDHYFKTGVKYSSCLGEKKNTCSSDLLDDVLFRNGF